MKQFLLILFFCPILFYAQPSPNPDLKGSISGKVLDSDSHEPIPYASIILNDQAGNLVTGSITEDNGSFVLANLEPGTFIFSVQFMGYQTHTEEIIISKHRFSIELPSVYLTADVAQLEDVVITAERSTIEQKIDRKVINIGKDLVTSGATALEIMNNLPSVNVDQDGNIALRGNQNVRVFVDGKPSNLEPSQLLKQIPSSSIKSIELITNPSAKFNPEGMSGIINIVLNKNSNFGFNGSVSGGITQGENTRANASLNLNYRNEKFNFFTNLGTNTGESFSKGQIENMESNSIQNFKILNQNGNSLIKAGLDYFVNEKNTISIYTNQTVFWENGFKGDMNVLYPNNEQQDILQDFDVTEVGLSSNYNLHWKRDFEKDGHNLIFEFDYGDTNLDEVANFDYEVPHPNFPAYTDSIATQRSLSLANLDYVNPLSDNMKLEVGAEARFEQTDNDYRTTNLDLFDAAYTYDRNIYSLYGTFSQSFGKFSYQFGARMENYHVEAVFNEEKVYEDDYLTLYPSAFITYNPQEKNQFQLSYSRRVDRPGLGQVNPIRQFATPRLTSVGNPELDPQFTNSLELNYTRQLPKGSITSGVFSRMINNPITQAILEDEENPENLILTHINGDNTNSYGFELNSNYKVFSFWDASLNFDFFRMKMNGIVAEESVEVDNTMYTFRINNSFKATKQLTFQLFGMYRGPVETIQFDIEDMYFINMGARYSFWDNKAFLSLNFNDVFDTQRQTLTTTRPQPQIARFNNETQTVYLGFNYRFGGSKTQSLERKQRDTNTQNGGGLF